MGMRLECDQCGGNPKHDDIYECGHCGEEFCELCLPKDMMQCIDCERVYHPECAIANEDHENCEWCGGKLVKNK